ncbi:MAG TPA: ABC transporter substrate-binding protein [Dehalococcoidia bacterium]|jgi:iron complex transport system substrate-binding protein|nr:ABC transporter substrate-binding protein [Dehalococcoidia bacterium]
MTQIASRLAVSTAVIALFIAACGGDDDVPAAPANGFPLTLAQSDDQELTLAAAPQRIVSLSTHATEIFCAIGAADQLVAVELSANCPLGSGDKPELDAYEPNLEAIASYQPDLVYVFIDSSGIVTALRRLNVPVLFMELPGTIEEVFDQIGLLGRIAARSEKAEEVAAEMQTRIDSVKKGLEESNGGPRVFHELDPSYFTASPDTFIGDLYTELRAQNIAEGASEEYPQLSAEEIVKRDPEVIVFVDEVAGVNADAIAARPGWNQISAVKDGRICPVDSEILSVPGPRIVEGMEAIARCLYPDTSP